MHEIPTIVALDFENVDLAKKFLQQVSPELCNVKVGLQLFTATGAYFVEYLINLGYKVFLDLKLFDIPNTVLSTCKVIANMGVWLCTLHIAGGMRMMQSAVRAVDDLNSNLNLLGVTVLTSTSDDELQDLSSNSNRTELVEHYVSLASKCALSGVVCSAFDTPIVHSIDNKLITVCPGLRFANTKINNDDQIHICDVYDALNVYNANYIVMGRSIINADNKVTLLEKILSSANA